MKKDSDNVLKKLAFDAKYRLRHCSYKNKQENMSIKRNMAFQNQMRLIKSNECRTPDITIKIINDYAEKEEFQNRVINLLKENEDCLNPLKRLADNKLLSLMSEEEKQRYILNLSERYNQVREDYYKSKSAYI